MAARCPAKLSLDAERRPAKPLLRAYDAARAVFAQTSRPLGRQGAIGLTMASQRRIAASFWPLQFELPKEGNTAVTRRLEKSIDMYRTFDDAQFVAWLSHPSDDRIAAYRKAGIRCRRRGDELFVHCADRDDAAVLDRRELFRTCFKGAQGITSKETQPCPTPSSA